MFLNFHSFLSCSLLWQLLKYLENKAALELETERQGIAVGGLFDCKWLLIARCSVHCCVETRCGLSEIIPLLKSSQAVPSELTKLLSTTLEENLRLDLYPLYYHTLSWIFPFPFKTFLWINLMSFYILRFINTPGVNIFLICNCAAASIVYSWAVMRSFRCYANS